MTPRTFIVQTTAGFDRSLRKLTQKHPDLADHYEHALDVLEVDPYNLTRQHAIKKLVNVDEAQWRFRAGRFRFRYDIEEQTVTLKVCTLRSEDTYR